MDAQDDQLQHSEAPAFAMGCHRGSENSGRRHGIHHVRHGLVQPSVKHQLLPPTCNKLRLVPLGVRCLPSEGFVPMQAGPAGLCCGSLRSCERLLRCALLHSHGERPPALTANVDVCRMLGSLQLQPVHETSSHADMPASSDAQAAANLYAVLHPIALCVHASKPCAAGLPNQAMCEDGRELLGELPPHLSRAGACWWLSVTNLTTVGYGGIVSGPFTLHPTCTLANPSQGGVTATVVDLNAPKGKDVGCSMPRHPTQLVLVQSTPISPPATIAVPMRANPGCMQSPETMLAYALCTTEHFCGLILSSLLLGVVVTKASIPTGKIVFSKVCLITTRCVSLSPS